MEYRPKELRLRQAYTMNGEMRSWIVEDCTDGSPLSRPMVFQSMENALKWIAEATE